MYVAGENKQKVGMEKILNRQSLKCSKEKKHELSKYVA